MSPFPPKGKAPVKGKKQPPKKGGKMSPAAAKIGAAMLQQKGC